MSKELYRLGDIFSISSLKGNREVLFTENRDMYYEEILSKDELLIMISELLKIHDSLDD